MKKVLCINDVHSGNMLEKGKVYEVLEEKKTKSDRKIYLIQYRPADKDWFHSSRFECVENTQETEDIVNHPKHYMGRKGIETINFIENSISEDEFKGYLKGNIIKYISRSGKKTNYIEDLEKAKWYINKLVEVLKNE